MKRFLAVLFLAFATVAAATDRPAIVIKSGALTEQPAADVLDVGTGVKNSAGTVTVTGTTGAAIQYNGTTNLSTGSGTVTVATGVELETTGTGMIDLPLEFKVNNIQVNTAVTAANLSTLTAGAASDATTLHIHKNTQASGLTTAGLTAGQVVYVSGTNAVSATDNASMPASRAVGVYTGTSGQIQLGGTWTALMTTVGGAPSAGDPLYLAAAADDTGTGAGKLTATEPGAGSVLVPIAICVDATNYAGAKAVVAIWWPQDPVQK